MNPYYLLRPLLYRTDAERTHDLAVEGMRRVAATPGGLATVKRLANYDDPRLGVQLFGQAFSSPLAVAAGLDKQGVAVPTLCALGFSLVEIGTVTPAAQEGSQKPRVFRLPEDSALINRMGFPSPGMETVAQNLRGASEHGVFALNVGPNKDRVDQGAGECLAVMRRFAELKSAYVVINVSSPNTQKLRTLQGKEALGQLLDEVLAGRGDDAPPLLVKISPDLTDAELDDILAVVTDRGLSGIVAANTSIDRPRSLRGAVRTETGGLSGRPIRDLSTRIVARIHEQSAGSLTIIAAGGVFSGADVLDKIGAGATLVQVYTGLIYEGPLIAKRVKRQMASILDRQGIASLELIRGTGYRGLRG
jgi:dihydroorotate dehydrogenase